MAGSFGGITRGLLIGAVPPAALTDSRYLLVSVLAGLITIFWYAGVDRLRSPMLLFDAAGLSLFVVAGAQKAIEFGLNPVMAALLGMLTGIGGGITRDVLLADIPQVLRSDLYAIAALAGASIVVIGDMLGLSYGISALAGGLLCFGLRFMAIRYDWRLPVAHLSARGRAAADPSNDEIQAEIVDDPAPAPDKMACCAQIPRCRTAISPEGRIVTLATSATNPEAVRVS